MRTRGFQPVQQNNLSLSPYVKQEVVTGYDNISSDVCTQEFPSKDALEIYMQSQMTRFVCPPYKFDSVNHDDIQQHKIQWHKQIEAVE